MKQRRLGPFSVAELGLGCMNLSHAYGAPPGPEQGLRVLEQAIERGVTLFDTAALYGFGANELLVGRFVRGRRDRLVLASKGGMAGVTFADGTKRVIDGRPLALRRDCEASLSRLGVEVIDLYYLHRVDRGHGVPVEESVGELSRLVEEGKVRALGLSEVSATTLRRAHRVHPIAALQSEYSLWTRNPEIATLAACRELGIAFVAFSPLGRGFLAGGVRDAGALLPGDIRKAMPRFAPENHAKNLALLEALATLASELGGTLAQLSLAWLLHRSRCVIPLFGTTRLEHLAEDLGAAELELSEAHMARLDQIVNERTVAGARYAPATLAEIDTEAFD